MTDARRISSFSSLLAAALLAAALFVPATPAAEPDPVLPASAVQDYRKARGLIDTNPAKALVLVDQLPPLEPVDEFRLKLISEVALSAGRVGEAIEALGKFREASSDPSARFAAALSEAELHLLGSNLEDCEKVVRWLQAHEDAVEGRPADERFLMSRFLRVRHDLMRARGEDGQARTLARRLRLHYPAEDATRQPGLTETDAFEAADRYARAKAFYRAWAYSDARRVFETLREHRSYGVHARWYLGQIALNKLRDRPEEAERLFGDLGDHGGYYADRAAYQYARSLMRQERYDAALRELNAHRKRFGNCRHTEDIFYYRGWLPYDHRENRAAIKGFKAYLDRYGYGRRSSYVHGFLAWTYMRLGEWKNAIATYEKMKPFGNMLVWGKALYWQAHAYRELGQIDRALAKLDALRDRYAVTYYAVLGEQLRAKINGQDPRASKVWWPEKNGTASGERRIAVADRDFEELSDHVRDRWKRVKALVALGERVAAREALEPIESRLRSAIPAGRRDEWTHAIGQFVGNYHDMWIEAAGTIRAMPDPPDPDSLEAVMAYPQAYKDIVEPVAREFDLPPYLMYAIMRQESRYSPGQVSHTNAVGALQMIPQTARKVARDLGIEYNPRTFHRPEVGFRFSGYYMKKLLDTFDGLYVPMATAYNSGPSVVAHWFEENPDASFPWLIEEFAYNEGRNYGRKVAEHIVRYLYLYEDDAKRRGAILDKLFPLSRDITIPSDVGY